MINISIVGVIIISCFSDLIFYSFVIIVVFLLRQNVQIAL